MKSRLLNHRAGCRRWRGWNFCITRSRSLFSGRGGRVVIVGDHILQVLKKDREDLRFGTRDSVRDTKTDGYRPRLRYCSPSSAPAAFSEKTAHTDLLGLPLCPPSGGGIGGGQ